MEEHLLLCEYCQVRLDRLEPEARLIRAVLAAEPAPEKHAAWFLRFRGRFVSVTAGIAVIVIGAFLFLRARPVVEPLVSLQLSAVRGAEPSIQIAGETDLSLTDTFGQEKLRAEVVDESGATVWTGAATSGSVKIAKQLRPGALLLRLYDSTGTLLHEYGFQVVASGSSN